MMAAELGLDVAMAKRGALLHDIGKVLTHEHEGTHVQLGVEVATKYGENPIVVNCIAAHHDDVPHESEVSVLVQAADAISGSRPGARREAFETYVKRLEGLEKIASSYRGVDRVFAIQAGREVRVVVTPDQVDDVRARHSPRRSRAASNRSCSIRDRSRSWSFAKRGRWTLPAERIDGAAIARRSARSPRRTPPRSKAAAWCRA
jgi:putative nucleotidyltransferase with HDIG domain